MAKNQGQENKMAGYIERITGTIPHTNKSVDIPLEGKSLIITGGNGSGKTVTYSSNYRIKKRIGQR